MTILAVLTILFTLAQIYVIFFGFMEESPVKLRIGEAVYYIQTILILVLAVLVIKGVS